jgi:hypothetical protein
MSDDDNLKPNKAELEFLNLAYNRFYDLSDEIMEDSFWLISDFERLAKVKDCFLIYTEILNYEPVQWTLQRLEKERPIIEAKIGKEYFSFIRNLLVHFPFFSKWDDIYFNRELINWCSKDKSIDKFLCEYDMQEPIKYRIWNFEKKSFTYVTIGFPQNYKANNKIMLSEMLPEEEGTIFSVAFMRRIIDMQVLTQ